MSLNRKNILGIWVTTDKREIILEEIKKWLDNTSGKPRYIVTPNPEHVVAAKGDTAFAKILNRADMALPDGIGLAWAAGVSRISGIDFMEQLVTLAAKRGYTIGLIGGTSGVAVKALECLSRRYPGLRGWTYEPGELSLSNLGNLSDLSEKIRKTNTRFVFVGLGAPKQEFYIEELVRGMGYGVRGKTKYLPHTSLLMPHTCVLMSVGGSFDMLSGSIQRAPVIIRNVGMEWLWRLMMEPWRWRRQLALVKFVWLLLREKISTG